VREGHLDTVQKMVESGADFDLVDNNGQTPLYYAIKHTKGEVCDFLLKKGAMLNISDKKG
jgi:ankyrin repeat protein